MIESVSDEAQARIDWNKVWSKKYPVLATYHKTVRINDYAPACERCSPSCGWTTAITTPMRCWYSKTFWPGYGRARCKDYGPLKSKKSPYSVLINKHRIGDFIFYIGIWRGCYFLKICSIDFPWPAHPPACPGIGSPASAVLHLLHPTPHTLPVMRVRFGS